MNNEKMQPLLSEMNKLQKRYELSSNVGPDYFEPGMMEYLDKSYGIYNEDTKEMVLRFESRGTRYEGRTARIESIKLGDKIVVARDKENVYNSNNFVLLDERGRNLGNMSATLCNALAPLYDAGEATITDSFVSFVEPISKRSRYAKQGMLFVEIHISFCEKKCDE